MQLAVVALVLRHQLEATETEPIGEMASSYLGPSTILSLHRACCFGSIKLLDWIWNSKASILSRRSNPHYYQWQFAESVNVAVEMGDLVILRWIIGHFSGCQVANKAVRTACKNGRLDILQCMLEKATVTEVQWNGANYIMQALESEQLEVARWFLRNISIDQEDRINVVKVAMKSGAIDVAELVLPEGRRVLDFAENSLHPNVVQCRLESHHAIPHGNDAKIELARLVCANHLSLLQQVVQIGEHPDFRLSWNNVLQATCKLGSVSVLLWMLKHPSGQTELRSLSSSGRLHELLCEAAAEGHVKMMEYLYDQRLIDTYGNALLTAIRKDQMSSVKWILRHVPLSEGMPDYSVLDEGAKFGRLAILQHFESVVATDARVFSGALMSYQNTEVVVAKTDHYLGVTPGQTVRRANWRSTDIMDDAAANGHLDVVRWLNVHRREGCSFVAMDCAAANGHLDVLKWLFANSFEGCTVKAIDGAAAHGHLAVVKWLHANTRAKCSKDAMDFAAAGGHLNVVKWLHSNRLEGCSAAAIGSAIRNGHIDVVCWLHKRFPELTPTSRDILRCDQLDMLLLVRTCFPKIFDGNANNHIRLRL